MITGHRPFVHDALFYGSDEQLAEGLVPFVRGGLDQDEPVVAVLPARSTAVLRDALGPSAGDVEFVDAVEFYSRPVLTISHWRDTIDRLTAERPTRVRGIGQVQFGDRLAGQRHWTTYEASLNTVFAERDAWIVCPYDTTSLPERVVRDASRTHPTVVDDGRRRPSEAYAWPEDLARDLAAPPRVNGETPLLVRTMPPDDLGAVRAAAAEVGVRLGLSPERVDDLVISLNEVMSNALRHGRGDVAVAVWTLGDEVVCRVLDHGGGLHSYLAGLTPPEASRRREGGLGLWVARHTVDRVDFEDGEDGFAVWLTLRR